jgi:heterodisulfide reductase subunit A-like polyferredoxin
MRRFIFILMIALLPLRGWMGEAMATEMDAINLVAHKAINTPSKAELADKNTMFECDMHKAQTAETKPAKSLCTHCQACHATGLANTVQIASFDKVQYAQPLAQASQFASASIAHSQKPPIL